MTGWHGAQRALLVGAGALLALFLVGPVAALVAETGGSGMAAGLAHPMVGPALALSAATTLATTLLLLVLGTPLAWVLSQSRGRTARVIETVLQLPAVLPPSVAGLALLVAFGRGGLFARWTGGVAFTTVAVVLAETFVAAPFYVQAATSAFRQLDPSLVAVARTMGAGPFTVLARVAVPIAWPGLVAGAVMAWARALGEFGATLMFAGNLEGRTQTMPLAIYAALEADPRASQALAVVLVAAALLVLVAARAAASRPGASDA
jgi:molybdate transport system permease protein